MNYCGATEACVREFLRRVEVDDGGAGWRLAESPVSGRGVFAARRFGRGEFVFSDVPLILGPRSYKQDGICVGCHHREEKLQSCPHGCGLPVCRDQPCAESDRHRPECALLTLRWGVVPLSAWSQDLLRAVTTIRGLILNPAERHLLNCLQSHDGKQHAQEVDMLKRQLVIALTGEDEAWMRHVCRVMDANAFETETEEGVSLRGLYPLAALLNHSCFPNMRHCFSNGHVMIVRTTRQVEQGEEMTTSYCPLLWDTIARRQLLQKTKHFNCCCQRCQDPTEFGTYLGGMACIRKCPGLIMRSDRGAWKCCRCKKKLMSVQVGAVLTAQASLLAQLDCADASTVMKVLNQGRLSRLVDVQLKLRIIWQVPSASQQWQELLVTELLFKEAACRELLELISALKLGDCRMKGLLLLELHFTLSEKLRRSGSLDNKVIKVLMKEAKEVLLEANDIFKNDVTSPKKLKERLQCVGQYL